MNDKKIILDTNALLRFITCDNAEKSQKVSDFIPSAGLIPRPLGRSKNK